MIYLLDTNHLIAYTRFDQKVMNAIEQFQAKELAISSMVFSEVLIGAHRSTQHNILNETFKLLNFFVTLDFTSKEAGVFANQKTELMKKGQIIEDADLIIASTALANNLTLVTNNTKHFQRIKGLKLENWAQK